MANSVEQEALEEKVVDSAWEVARTVDSTADNKEDVVDLVAEMDVEAEVALEVDRSHRSACITEQQEPMNDTSFQGRNTQLRHGNPKVQNDQLSSASF